MYVTKATQECELFSPFFFQTHWNLKMMKT